jgi:hypothetical protein
MISRKKKAGALTDFKEGTPFGNLATLALTL